MAQSTAKVLSSTANGPTSAVAVWRGASKHYGEVRALDGLSLEVHPGEALAILGPNGAGKTTAIHLLLGLITPDQGEVSLAGGSPRDPACRAGVGAVLQTAGLPARIRIGELLAQHASYFPRPRSVAEALALVGLEGFAARPLRTLSGGERRRVELALALIGCPRLLVLDEPTVGIDVRERRALLETIAGLRDGGCAIVLTTHLMDEAERLATRVALIAHGRLRAVDTPLGLRRTVGERSGRVMATSTLSDDALHALAAVGSVQRDRTRIELASRDRDATARALLAADPAAHDLEVHALSLEDAYLNLTEEPAR